jgi:hypothetical protein
MKGEKRKEVKRSEKKERGSEKEKIGGRGKK